MTQGGGCECVPSPEGLCEHNPGAGSSDALAVATEAALPRAGLCPEHRRDVTLSPQNTRRGSLIVSPLQESMEVGGVKASGLSCWVGLPTPAPQVWLQPPPPAGANAHPTTRRQSPKWVGRQGGRRESRAPTEL